MAEPPPSVRRPFDERAASAALGRLSRRPGAPWLHGEVARRMAERLALIRLQPAWILDWWGTLGGSSEVLAEAYPNARRTLVEPDDRWAERGRAEQARPWWSARHWVGAKIDVQPESAALAPGAQLVWSNMMLHAISDPPALFARWEGLLSIDGFVMFSCLGPGTLRQLRELYARLGWPAPSAPFIDMHDLGDMMVGAGFADPVMDQETLTLRWSTPQTLLSELRALGGNAAADRFQGLRTPRWLARLHAELDTLRGDDGRIGLDFEVAYGHAFKAAPRVRTGAPTHIALDDMRRMVRKRGGPGSAA